LGLRARGEGSTGGQGRRPEYAATAEIVGGGVSGTKAAQKPSGRNPGREKRKKGGL